MARILRSAARLFFLARAVALPLVLAAAPLVPAAPAFALDAGPSVALEPLTIVTGAGSGHPVEHQLAVEVMRTEAEREHGLMDRRYLPPDRGMLFQFDHEQNILMWMKNTYIPLDMIFISPKGAVTHIHENAEPMSEVIIPSEGPALGVLEVNAGYARKIGLKPGDRVRHPMFAR
ncbi:DUF192 domain-containing protein [Rhodoblastus sp.]|uniref:DUF192 domain-containing protein n=1 Tax=Rhodoblastus sp. TaxID=1962975 RepID=UPI00262D6E91|nr:DUF192 domain-containing protein [Rhodoblastus sp.]